VPHCYAAATGLFRDPPQRCPQVGDSGTLAAIFFFRARTAVSSTWTKGLAVDSGTTNSDLPMLKQISLPLVHWRRLPPVFFLSMGALLGLLLTAFVLGERGQQKNRELLQDFGNALAQLAAKDVVDASISHDLVSMHAVMQEVQAQPRVLMAAVHDLEQTLLVQAGQLRIGVDTQAFSAPIPLHDSIAGHVTITLNAEFPGESALRWAVAGTALLLLLLVALALYDTRGDAWELRPVSLLGRGRSSEDEDISAGDDLDEEWPPVPGFGGAGSQDGSPDWEEEPVEAVLRHSDLVLAIPNRQRLEQQLNGDMFAELVERFDSALDDVLALYGGVRVGAPTKAGIYCIRFTSSESASEAAFRAVCSAHLIYELNRHQRIRFQVVAEVCHPEFDVKLAVSDTGIFIQTALLDALLQARVDTLPVDDDRVSVAGFKPPFSSLLERQQEQLLAD
jgi:uncharacterized membrane protein affecting hemolysin expression